MEITIENGRGAALEIDLRWAGMGSIVQSWARDKTPLEVTAFLSSTLEYIHFT